LDDEPNIVICIDDWAAMRAGIDDLTGTMLDRWHRIFADGPGVGVFSIVTMDRAQAMSSTAASSFGRRFAFQLNDPMDDSILGIPRSAPIRKKAGRALDLSDMSEVQFAVVNTEEHTINKIIGSISTRWADCHPSQLFRIDTLPSFVCANTIKRTNSGIIATFGSTHHDEPLALPIGLGDQNLTPVGWNLLPGEHALITGPSGSGKTNALVVVAAAALANRPGINISVLCGRRQTLPGALSEVGIVHTAAESLTDVIQLLATRPATPFNDLNELILVDDSDLIDDPTGVMTKLIASRPTGVWIVASGRADTLRTSYGHWTVPLRRSRKGLALRPHLELDGELWATSLPRRAVRGGTRSMPQGRGFLLDDGHTELVQVGCFSPIESGNETPDRGRIAS
jgi:DNA segregation ATPase FtsK/SpoIIIE, S-DNA-T family